jgi:pyrimidine operon attenuation protein/uracil phosphoribosyltransferase
MRKQILSNLNLPTPQRRMAVELLELLNPNQPVFLLGIEKNGSPLALQLKTHLHEQQPSLRIHIASVRLNKSNPESEAVHALQDLDFMGCQVVVVDDVLNTGRTAMAVIAAAALKVPAAIRLLVCSVDRCGSPPDAHHVGGAYAAREYAPGHGARAAGRSVPRPRRSTCSP